MSYRVCINPLHNNKFSDCHDWWKNFRNFYYGRLFELGYTRDTVDEFYMDHGFQIDENSEDHIIFNSEESYTWFVLVWS